MGGWIRTAILWVFTVVGLGVAALAGLADHFPAVAALCAGFAGGCRETAEFAVLGLPLWAWGVAFYLILGVSLWKARGIAPHLVGAGLGVEAWLVWIMYSHKLACVFCLANLAVVLVLAGAVLSRERFWPMAACGLLLFMAAQGLVARVGGHPAAEALKAKEAAVVARVGQEAITEIDLEAALGARLHDLTQQIHRLKRDRLAEMVMDRVLGLEAAARGLEIPVLVEKEVLSSLTPVTDAEVEAYRRDNRAALRDWKGTEPELAERIRDFLRARRSEEGIKAFARSLEPRYGVSYSLAEPVLPLIRVETEGSPALGPANATVTVVEFSDYECPACRRGHGAVRQVREQFLDRVRWVFKDLPLDMHKKARKAAEAARCAGDLGRFWEMQDALYTAEDLGPEGMTAAGVGVGLDPETFRQCLDSGRHAAGVTRDAEQARAAGLEATPTFLVNGRPLTGTPSPDRFREILDQALAASRVGVERP